MSGGYARGARVLSVGIGVTGLVTFTYFSLASYALTDEQYGPVALLWSVMFVIVSVCYRPVEQLLQRTVATARAHGEDVSLRRPALLQACFAGAFLVLALAFMGPLRDDVFGGSPSLYWILVAGVTFYAASYFARGFFAGSGRFAAYGGLVLLEAGSRLLFALAVVVGIASGQTAVALGMAAAPLVSLMVVPWALRRRGGAPPAAALVAPTATSTPAAPLAARSASAAPTARETGGFAAAVVAVQVAEQTLINAAVLTVHLTSPSAAVAGVVFNALLIARAPLQLFQAIQGSLLPALASAEALADAAAFRRAVRVTVLAIAAFAGAVALGLLLLGPWAMDLLFEDTVRYERFGLALVAVGMGFHLVAGTLNQAALARHRIAAVASSWLLAAAAFVAWMLLPVVGDELLRAEAGYAGATALLCLLLVLTRAASPRAVTARARPR